MKYQITLIALLFSFLNLQAQTFKGIITNALTKEPVSQITVVSEDNTFFTTSNEDGEIILPNEILNRKIIIDDYEYLYSEKIFTSSQSFTWNLTPNSETLEEIVIYKNPELVLDEIIANSIKSFSGNLNLETYYRENYIENNKLARFSDGIIDFYVPNGQGNIQ